MSAAETTRHVFGPLHSRRLGRSLGIDPVPAKTCNWNCVYCQLGRTHPLTYERGVYAPVDEILAEVRAALSAPGAASVDYVTFAGSGEPTLHAGIGRLIGGVRALTDVPVAVITNGSLLYRPDVRSALTPADVVMPSLDAGSPDLYRRINRPHRTATFERLVDGLQAFRRQYRGRLWVEVMLVRGLNDTTEALHDLADVLRTVEPDEVHLVRPTRPPAEGDVRPADDAAAARALAILGAAAPVSLPQSVGFETGDGAVLTETILGVLARHPAGEDELRRWLGRCAPGREASILEALRASGKVQVVERYGGRFWTVASTDYASEDEDVGDRA